MKDLTDPQNSSSYSQDPVGKGIGEVALSCSEGHSRVQKLILCGRKAQMRQGTAFVHQQPPRESGVGKLGESDPTASWPSQASRTKSNPPWNAKSPPPSHPPLVHSPREKKTAGVGGQSWLSVWHTFRRDPW